MMHGMGVRAKILSMFPFSSWFAYRFATWRRRRWEDGKMARERGGSGQLAAAVVERKE
jgi:hypothetical protein